MSKIITVINMKGGVGKTTLSVNMSYILSKYHGKKTLLIDIDPQFNATQYLVDQKIILNHFRTKKTVYDILMPKKDEEVSLTLKRKKETEERINLADYTINIYKNGESKLDLIPSSLKLINFETSKRGVESLLKKFLKDNCTEYDYIVIDCPPTLSLLTLSAYLASEYYLIPIKPDYLSSLGLPLLDRGLKEYEDLHSHKLNLLGIVFTMVTNTTIANEVMESVESSGWECFESISSHSTKVAKSVESIVNFHENHTFARYSEEFKNITQELLTTLEDE